MPGTLLLIAKAANAKEILSNQLREIFQGSILVKARCLDELCQEDIDEASLVLFSNKAVFNEYKNSKNMLIQNFLVAERYIYLDNLNEIIALPQGEKALVVSNLKISAEDTINEIIDVGINHLRLIPYYPGCGLDINGIDVAISPAAGDIVPAGIKKVIDVGVRRIAISTIFKITNFFNLPIEIVDKYIIEYTREFILQAEKLNRTITTENRLNHELDAILNSVHDAIVATDADCNITVFNPKAEELFGYKRTEVMGKNICKIIPQNNFRKIIGQKKALSDTLERIGNRHLISNKTPLFMDGTVTGVVATYQDVTEMQRLEQEVRGKLYERGHVARFNFDDIVNKSDSMYSVVKKAKKFAASEEPVLLRGETGVGKEMFAQAIHNHSDRRNGPFIAVNFGALPENLAESELFGYEEGAFTGARKGGKPGLFELAHNGTIFLDEIGDATLSTQVKILRILQEKCVIRLGATKVIPVNVRIIAATNRDLKELIRQGKFREDLYYRLNVLSISIPSLRERKEDIVALAEYFMSQYCPGLVLSDEVKMLFYNYPWPGNVRELENVIRYISATCENKEVRLDDLPHEIINMNLKDELSTNSVGEIFRSKDRKAAEYEYILRILKHYYDTGRVCGRGTILLELNNRYGLGLTEEKVRWRLQTLSKMGYINIGRTKQGCKITENGMRVLEMLNRKAI
ncbi:sigma 54-interacting transcriptional regulator [Calorimonas adulescens]|uniref:PAS domain S-box protein n=1 Tax=Calorimonas adulescens TaxID=2606906 RepID=A0A5D8QCC4_9THEO|nr:sigma 54-interacting transcriptional regulator [Calorimonas adulescens]TZE80978.1 PAS domain S-box protein [Calorimonas adulescens]